MLDKIQGSQADLVNRSASADRINEIDLKNRYQDNDLNYIVDESEISSEAYQKYERELDIKRFSQILLDTDEKEATERVLKKAFDGTISISETDILGDLVNNNDLLNDII